MVEMTQQAVPAEAKDTNENQPEFILTKSGVMIVGSEYIGDKLTALICEAVAMNEGSGLSTIVLRHDGYPCDNEGPVFGMTFADTHSFAVNLEHCWQRALEVAKSGEKNLSLLGVLWINVLSTVGHELDHIDLSYGDRNLFEEMRNDEEGNKDLEIAAKETAQALIMKLCLKYDTEIPAISELGWLGARWMALHTDPDTKDLDWVIKARKMAEEGIVYEEKDNEVVIKSFREFVKQAYDGKGKEDWSQPTTACNIAVHLEDGTTEMIMAEPVEEPKVEAVEMEAEAIENAEAPVEAVEVPAAVMAGMGASAQFVGAGTVASEAEMDADNDMAVPLPAPVQQAVAATTAAAATATPPAAYSEPTYPPCNMDLAVSPQFMKGVYQALYHHVFTKCGWQQNPQTGRFFFANAAAILEGVNIQHLITQFGAENFIMEYDTLNAQGQYAAEKCEGMIRGRTTSQQGLPSYSLYLNINGQKFKRSFLPQNPEKVVNNAYTKSADDAAAGNMIVWVFKDEAADNAPFKEKCAVKIRNNEYEVF